MAMSEVKNGFAGRNEFRNKMQRTLLCSGEIFYSEYFSVALDDADAYRIQVLVQKVGAMRRRMHPEVVNGGGGGSFGDIFSEGGEMGAGLGDASREAGLAGKLMGDGALVRHFGGVAAGGAGQSLVPFKR